MSAPTVEIRASSAADIGLSQTASDLIASASDEFDIARRHPEFLEAKIQSGQAVFALDDHDLVGFGYFSDWDYGRFVSHSGLIVKPEYRGRGLGRRLKLALLKASRQQFPHAVLMSLTTSPEVKAMNLKLGFQVVPIEELTTDAAFWAGCKSCCRYTETLAKGLKCCCEGMVLRPNCDGSTSV
jgi:ribosomal protein S18 acetylase RimI-like enzyme